MLDKYTGSYTTAQADAVAWLMRYVGQEEQMDYTPSGSGAMGADILRAFQYLWSVQPNDYPCLSLVGCIVIWVTLQLHRLIISDGINRSSQNSTSCSFFVLYP